MVGNNIAYCIITYNLDYAESVTYNSLINQLNISKKANGTNVIIHNNTPGSRTPLHVDRLPSGVTMHYVKNGVNLGISRSYNAVAQYAQQLGCKKLVFLDQDTTLPESFVGTYEQIPISCNIAVPKVMLGQNVLSPSRVKFFRNKLTTNDRFDFNGDLQNYSFINTGLFVDIDFFFMMGAYDEVLFLDFCDHDFADRVRDCRYIVESIPVCLEQSLSAIDNDLNSDLNRFKIFKKDFKVYARKHNYILMFVTVYIPHLIRLCVKHKSLEFLSAR